MTVLTFINYSMVCSSLTIAIFNMGIVVKFIYPAYNLLVVIDNLFETSQNENVNK